MKIAQLIATGILGLALPLSLMGQERARLDTTIRLDLRGTVDLSLVSGRIVVRGWDSPDVNIQALTENGVLRFDATPSRLTLRVDPEGERGRPRGTRAMMFRFRGDSTQAAGRLRQRYGQRVAGRDLCDDRRRRHRRKRRQRTGRRRIRIGLGQGIPAFR